MSGNSKRALVTGGAVRIGAALCRALAGRGFDVAVHCHRSVEEARLLVDQLCADGCRASFFAADLTDDASACGLPERVRAEFGRLSLLVNNAGTFVPDRLESMDTQSWSANIGINLRGPMLLAQSFVRQLGDDGTGLIVNMIDQRVRALTFNYLSYSVSKAGLWTATQVMAMDLAPDVRVNAIAPGLVLPAPGYPKVRFDALVEKTPLQRATEPEEIAAALRLILDTPSMTGQMITIDSGQSLGRAATS